jgi:hypothetical protein
MLRLLMQFFAVSASAVVAAGATAGGGSRTLTAGVLDLPAAQAFGEPGFHQVLAATRRLPRRLGGSAGMKLVLTLRDATRPRQRCSSDHPLSGCATVDWSDDPSRPGTPPSGVFRNTLTIQLASGRRTFFLRPTGTMGLRPNPFEPG